MLVRQLPGENLAAGSERVSSSIILLYVLGAAPSQSPLLRTHNSRFIECGVYSIKLVSLPDQ